MYSVPLVVYVNGNGYVNLTVSLCLHFRVHSIQFQQVDLSCTGIDLLLKHSTST